MTTEPLAFDLDALDAPQQRLLTAPPWNLTFTLFGEPIPKGSTKAFVVAGRARVTNDNPRTRNWQNMVNDAAHLAMRDDPPVTGPLAIALRFTFARPGSVSSKKRPHPSVKPDIDKIARAALDALTGCVFLDDAQVVDLVAVKRYVGHPHALREPGLVVDAQQVLP